MTRRNRSFGPALVAIAMAIGPGGSGAAELVEVVKMVEPGVVRVDTNRNVGSGAIIDDDGLVVTNFHVVDGATEVKLVLRSGEPLAVQGFLMIDAGRDLALLKTEKLTSPRAIKIAAGSPQVGEKAAAFGNPRGFDFSTSEGIVSATRTGRQVAHAIGDEAYRAGGYDLAATWVQTTAPISPGNSGGPLVNMQAELLGLNTWNYPDGQNLNFAISAADIKNLIAKAASAPLQSIAKLPRVRGKRSSVPDGPERNRLKDFKVTFPTGRVFSFGVFHIDPPLNRVATVENGNGIAVMKHSNGSLYAAASQVNGILDGITVAQYDSREPMVFATYAEGKRHGVLRTYNEAGEPVLFAQYAKGKPHGFSAFFHDDDLRMIAEHQNGAEKWIQLMSGFTVLEGFSDREAAEKNSSARDLFARLDKVEEGLKQNEVVFKKQVKDYNLRLRKAMSARVALEKRKQMLADINRQNAANATFHSQLLQKAVAGRW